MAEPKKPKNNDIAMSQTSKGRSDIGKPSSSASSYKSEIVVERVDIDDGDTKSLETLNEVRAKATTALEKIKFDFGENPFGHHEDFTEMTSNVFDYLKELRDDLGVPKVGPAAIKWMRDTIKQLHAVEDISAEEKFLRDEERLRSRTSFKRPGQMFMFNYQPLTRVDLDYYDTFPLVFIIELHNDGFTGINLHYLPSIYRERLFLLLMKFASGSFSNKDTRLILRYKYMMTQPLIRKYMKPCIKKYFYRRMDSYILRLPPEDWYIATFLPLARFKKKHKNSVWKETRLKIFREGLNMRDKGKNK
jgi:hypothetical protein